VISSFDITSLEKLKNWELILNFGREGVSNQKIFPNEICLGKTILIDDTFFHFDGVSSKTCKIIIDTSTQTPCGSDSCLTFEL
jgi:hypothetical protein